MANLERTQELIDQTKQNLRKGTFTIKEGHRVKNLNPEGNEVTLPLGSDQIIRKEFAIRDLEYPGWRTKGTGIKISRDGGEL